MSELTFEQVIEEHRVAIGAKAVKITPGPDATPETLRAALQKMAEDEMLWRSFPVELRLRAEIEQLNERLRKVGRLGQSTFGEFRTQPKEVANLKRAIHRLTDIISLDRSEAIAYCQQKMAAKTPV